MSFLSWLINVAKITIIDIEWYNGYSKLPKPLCMKLSSYHKQLGDIINFAETSWQIGLDFDVMYVVREGTAGTLPKEIPMHNDKVYLIGNGFRYYNRYLKELPTAIDSCRPDYLLYKIDEENNMTKANIIQFYSRDGKRLPLIQDYHRAIKGSKWNLVIDEKFWEHTYEDIAACVQTLKLDKNVVFQHEIKLDNIFDGYDSGGNAICFEEKKYIINYLDYNCCQYEDKLKKVLYKHFEPYKLDALNYLRRMEFSQEGIPLKISAKEFLRKLPRSQSTIRGRFSDWQLNHNLRLLTRVAFLFAYWQGVVM